MVTPEDAVLGRTFTIANQNLRRDHVAKQERYAIRLPMPAGGKDYVHVDPKLLDPSVLEVFIWVAEKKGGSWKPDHGFAFLQTREIDTTVLRDSYQRIMQEIEEIFANYGDEGRVRFKEFVDALNILGFMNALVEHRVHAADTALQDTLYALLSAFSGLLGELAEAKKKAADLAATTEHLSASFGQIDESAMERLKTWGEAAERIVATHDELTRIEQDLIAFRDMTRDAEREWKRDCALEHPLIHTVCAFLNGDDANDEGFTLRAMSVVEGDASIRATFEPLIARAREHIEKCQKLEERSLEGWHALARDVPSEVSEKVNKARILCDQLREARRTFDDRQGQSISGTALPYEAGWGTEATYKKAVRIKSDLQWVVNVVRNRIDKVATDIHRMLTDEPRLPIEAREALRNAERQIDKLEASWGSTPSSGEEAPSMEEGAPVCTTSGPINAERMEELYELLICVAHELTCNPKMPCGSWVSAMLDLLCRMQRCTAEEKVSYHDVLKSRFDKESELAETEVIPHWKVSVKTWIAYRDPRNKHIRFKLALSAKHRAEQLLQRHAIKGTVIRSAHAARRSEQTVLFLTRGGKRSPQP